MGNAGLHATAAQQESGAVRLSSKEPTASYSIIRFAGSKLPKSYEGLIFTRWLRSLRYGNEYFNRIDPDAYYAAYDGYISRLLDHYGTYVRLAVLSDKHDVVLGFAVGGPNLIHYVHVHKDYRRQGIGKSLIPDGGIEPMVFTHLTKTGSTIWEAKYPKWIFNPFFEV